MDHLKDILLVIAAAVGLLTFIIGLSTFIVNVAENRKQGRQKRFELFLEMERKYQDDPFRQIRSLINDDTDQQKLKDIPKRTRNDFASFFEAVAIMKNSGLITKEVACYMYSHDAIACWKSDSFWHDFEWRREDAYWGVLKGFVLEMEELRGHLFPAERGILNIPNRKMSF
jgi:hypothetical protein